MKDKNGKTPIHYAIEIGYRKMFNPLKDASAEIDLDDCKGMIHEAAHREYCVDCVKFLLEIGVDVNEADELGLTALHHAARHDASETVITLIEAGANVNAEDIFGNIPLHYAVERKSILIIGYLIDFNSNIDHQNKEGKTPLHLAIQETWNDFLARLLIAKKASIHLADNEGNTPLHLATSQVRQEHLVPILLNLTRPQELNRQNNQGETPLHLAVLINDLPLVKQLLDKEADLNLKTKLNKTALDLARDYNYTDIANYLVTKASK